MSKKITVVEKTKWIVYADGEAIGSIKQHPSKEEFRFNAHGGGSKSPWFMSIEAAQEWVEQNAEALC